MKKPCTVNHKPGSKRQRMCLQCGDQRPTVDRPVALTQMPSSGRGLPAKPELSVELRDGKKFREEWHLYGALHREDGPAVVEYRKSGSPSGEVWYLDGVLHREDGPAQIYYHKNGNPSREGWYLDGERHHEDGPAITLRDEDGSPTYEFWYLNGKPHREDGPAAIEYYESGVPPHEVWYLDGAVVSREEVAAAYLTKHFQPVSETNVDAVEMLLAQGELSELTAEQVEFALKVHPNL